MKLKRVAGACMVAALALGPAACGDEEQDEQSKVELTEAANRICDKFEKRLDDIEEPGNPRNTQQAATYWDEAAPAIEAAYIEFSALDPGEDTKNDWSAFLAKQRELKDVTATVAKKTIKGDRSYINDLSEVESISNDSERLARQVGANGCA